jgi:hypothetical protein
VLTHVEEWFTYEYDFGDGWSHSIELEEQADEPSNRPYICLAGERACPPEDCGGVPGYERIVYAMEHPLDSDTEELLEWLGPFDPEAFDIDRVNSWLKRMKQPSVRQW